MRWLADISLRLSRSRLPVAVLLGTAVFGTGVAASASPADLEPVVHVYDVKVTGVLHTKFSHREQGLFGDTIWSETATWTATYTGARLSQQSLSEESIGMELKSKGVVTASISYRSTGRERCTWSTTRRDPAFLSIDAMPAGTGYRVWIGAGPSGSLPMPRLSKCTYYGDPRLAQFADMRVAADGGVASGWIDTRNVVFRQEIRTPPQPGRLGYPADRLQAGRGFVLNLKGKTTKPFGSFVSEGTATITFTPRPA